MVVACALNLKKKHFSNIAGHHFHEVKSPDVADKSKDPIVASH